MLVVRGFDELKSKAGLRGAEAYLKAPDTVVPKHCAAIDDDVGQRGALGIYAAVSPPWTVTDTGFQCSRAARTVSSPLWPGL